MSHKHLLPAAVCGCEAARFQQINSLTQPSESGRYRVLPSERKPCVKCVSEAPDQLRCCLSGFLGSAPEGWTLLFLFPLLWRWWRWRGPNTSLQNLPKVSVRVESRDSEGHSMWLIPVNPVSGCLACTPHGNTCIWQRFPFRRRISLAWDQNPRWVCLRTRLKPMWNRFKCC